MYFSSTHPFHQGSCALPKPNPPKELKNSLPKNGKDCWKNTAGLGEFTSVVMVSTSGQEIQRLSMVNLSDYYAKRLTERSVFKARCGLRRGYRILASLLSLLLLLLLLQWHKLRVAEMVAAIVAAVDWQQGRIKWDMRRLRLLRCQRCRRRCSPDACDALRG